MQNDGCLPPCPPACRTLRLPAYHAHVEAHVLQDVEAARKVWEGVLKTGLGRCVCVRAWVWAGLATQHATQPSPHGVLCGLGSCVRAWVCACLLVSFFPTFMSVAGACLGECLVFRCCARLKVDATCACARVNL